MNIYGSRAEVIVRERIPKPEIWYENEAADVIAGRTGFVRSVRALCGTPLVRPGSAVLAGETLISGDVDSVWGGRHSLHATGAVRAETFYVLRAKTPLEVLEKRPTGDARSRWALLIGKNRYNFYRDCSISGPGCDRIKTEWSCSLGTLFSLPLRLVRETERPYTLERGERDQNLARRELEELLRARLRSALGQDGTVTEERFDAVAADGCLTVTLRARCEEDIAVEQKRARG